MHVSAKCPFSGDACGQLHHVASIFAATDSLPLLSSLLRECQQDPDWDDDFTVGDLVKRYVPCQKAWDTG